MNFKKNGETAKGKLARSSALAGVAFAAVSAVSGAAVAQTADTAAPSDEAIVVTGSRIIRHDLTSPVPLQTFNAEQIDQVGATNVIDVLRTLPSVGVSTFSRTNSNFDVNNSGVNTLNLRNLGDSRTLVLVDGKRWVAGVPGDSAVDFNTIPTDMIERVDVITGGASAVYGSDAVAGVVNVITKSNFEGVQLRAETGQTRYGDGETTQASLTIGSHFADDRGHALFNFNYALDGEVASRDRPWERLDILRSAGSGNVTVPQFSSFGAGGRFWLSGQNGVGASDGVNQAGNVVPWSTLNLGFNRSAERLIAVPATRYQFGSKIDYDITPDITAFADGYFTHVHSVSSLEPFPLSNGSIYGSDATTGVPLTNWFFQNLPNLQQLRNDVAASGETSIPFSRRLVEDDNRGSTNDRDTYRFTVGLRGTLSDDLNWDLSYVRGHTQQAQVSTGQVNVASFRNALDSIDDGSGNPICADPIAVAQGCVPINIFGFGQISQAAADYVRATSTRNAEVTQDTFEANLTGNLFAVPAGDISFATGLAYREEESSTVNDPLTQAGLNAGNKVPNISGGFDVFEVYAEALVPLISDGFIKSWNVEGSYRISDYSSVGKTDSWTVRSDLSPFTGLMFRAAYSQATRAPNIGELFDPGTQDFPQVQDPCEGVTAASTGIITAGGDAARCLAIPGMLARIASDGGAFTPTQTEIQGVTSFVKGNPNLDAEVAKTITAGFTWQPSFIPHSSLTVDYYDIKVDNAIASVTAQTELTLCYTVGQFCGAITRNNVAAIDRVDSQGQNADALEVEGFDVTATYGLDLDSLGNVNFAFTYTHENKDTLQEPEAPKDDTAGFLGDPKDRFTLNTNYSLGGWSANWRVRYIGESDLGSKLNVFGPFDPVTVGGIDFVGSHLDAWWYSDVQLQYAWDHYSIAFGVNNVADEKPPIIGEGVPGVDTGTGTEATLYDVFGRSWYVRAIANF